MKVEVTILKRRSRVFERDLGETSFRFGIRRAWRSFLEFLFFSVTSGDGQWRGVRRSMIEGRRILGLFADSSGLFLLSIERGESRLVSREKKFVKNEKRLKFRHDVLCPKRLRFGLMKGL